MKWTQDEVDLYLAATVHGGILRYAEGHGITRETASRRLSRQRNEVDTRLRGKEHCTLKWVFRGQCPNGLRPYWVPTSIPTGLHELRRDDPLQVFDGYRLDLQGWKSRPYVNWELSEKPRRPKRAPMVDQHGDPCWVPNSLTANYKRMQIQRINHGHKPSAPEKEPNGEIPIEDHYHCLEGRRCTEADGTPRPSGW